MRGGETKFGAKWEGPDSDNEIELTEHGSEDDYTTWLTLDDLKAMLAAFEEKHD